MKGLKKHPFVLIDGMDAVYGIIKELTRVCTSSIMRALQAVRTVLIARRILKQDSSKKSNCGKDPDHAGFSIDA
jgi:hypothetical protein